MSKYKIQRDAEGKEIIMVLDYIEFACTCDTMEKLMGCGNSIMSSDECSKRFADGTFSKRHYKPYLENGKEVVFDSEKLLNKLFDTQNTYNNIVQKYEENLQWMKEHSKEGLQYLGWVARESENEKLLFTIERFKHIFEK